MQHVSLAVFDYNRKKLCDIYNSSAEAAGQAKNIVLTQELSGWKELSFELPTPDFRWGYIKNDCLIRLKIGNEADWFVIQTPKTSNTGRMQTNTVKCPHVSSILKTKNLYLIFDDENGIGKIDYLISRALTNTGWTLGECDTFYERDGETEKIRSLSSSGKKGAYQQITDICNLFNAYPVYHGDSKTVDIRELTNKKPVTELFIGKNLETLNVEYKSDSIVTRLYVEGEYGEDGYVGIDDVNPTGLTFLLDFDYYRQIGLFNTGDEVALRNYTSQTTGMPAVNAKIKAKMAEINEGETLLNTMQGQCDFDLYFLVPEQGQIERNYNSNTALNVYPHTWAAGKQYQKGDLVNGENNVLYRAQTASKSATFVAEEWKREIADDDQIYLFANTADTGTVTMWMPGVYYEKDEIVKYENDIYKAKRNHGGYYTWEERDPITGQIIQHWEYENPQFTLNDWEKIVTLGEYEVVTGAEFEETERYITSNRFVVRFNTLPSGTIGARQVAIESKEKMITTLQGDKTKFQDVIDEETEAKEAEEEELANLPEDASETTRRNLQQSIANHQIKIETYEQKIDAADEQIAAYQDSIADIYNGTEDATGLYEAMGVAVELAIHIADLRLDLIDLLERQEQIESAFANRMGDRLKDGYWSDTNYAVGQEQLLYYDALDRMEQVSKPQVKYTVSQLMLSEYMGGEEFVPEINAKVKILDDKLEINDIAYVSKRVQYLDDPRKGSIEISTEDLISATSKSFEVVMSKVTQMADVVNQRNSLYERAQAINANGTLPVDKISGTINIQQSNITSPKSTWYTDEAGAMIFESVLGDSAYKIGGDGFMIATSKLDGENWDWRLFGDGFGFDASALTSGVLNSDVIADGSVGSGKLGGSVGRDLNIEENKTIIAHNDQMHAAGLELSPEGIWAYTVDNTTGLGEKFSEISQTASEIRSEVAANYGSLHSEISQTASQIRLEVENLESGQRSELSITASEIRAEVENTESGLRSEISVTASQIRSEVSSAYGSLHSEISQTASEIRAEVEDTESGLRSEIKQTASEIRAEVENKESGLRSEISITASQIRSEVSSVYGSLHSEISQTASKIRLEIENSESTLRSELSITESSIRAEVVNVESGLRSEISQTASGIRSEVTNVASGLRSSIKQNADSIGLIVKDGKVDRASIILAINGSGGSSAKIDADEIDLSSDVTFGSNIRADGYITCSSLYVDQEDISNVTITGGRAVTDSSGVTTIYYTDMNGAERELANFNIADTKKYKDGVSAVGLEVDAENGVVKKNNNSSTKSVTITAGNTNINYNSSTHKYSTTHEAYAGNALMSAVNKTTGTEAYEDGTTYGKGLMGVSVDIEDMKVNVAESSTKSLNVSCTQSDLSYNTSSHKYSTTSTTQIGGSTVWTQTKYSGTEAYEDGQNSVTINKGAWSSGAIAFTKSAGTASTKTVSLSLTPVQMTSTDPNKWTVTAYDGNSNTGATTIVDATSRYTAGETAGAAAGAAGVTVSSVVKYQADSYDTDTHNYTVYVRGTASNNATKDNSLTVNGASAYNAGAASVTVTAGSITVTG